MLPRPAIVGVIRLITSSLIMPRVPQDSASLMRICHIQAQLNDQLDRADANGFLALVA